MPMASCSLHSSTTLTSISPSLSRAGLIAIPSLHLHFLKFRSYPHLKFLNVRAQASGTRNISSEAVEATPMKVNPKEGDIAFVAGATGKVGSRTVRELLKLGFRVRAGVRSAQKAETLVQSVKKLKLDVEGAQPVEMLEIVECDLERQEQIGAALGNASVVLCCIGASEKEVFDISGPYRIDYQATKNLIDAATIAKVKHFILVTSLGTNKVGFPAAILNLFWGVLIWKRKAEEALIASGVPYTIVRPGGMERPTDAYKETHNITLSPEDTLFGGQVSNLQVAEFLAVVAKNRSLSYCKVVEVIAETTAPLTPMEELLTRIPYQRTPPKELDVATPDPELSKSVISETPDPELSKSVISETPDPELSKSVISEAPSTPIEKESPTAKEKKITPLSPYAAYEDLKPPTSPTPTPSTTGQKKSVVNVADAASMPISSVVETSTTGTTNNVTETISIPEEVQKTRPLSPYAAYEDLKPPTSPCPTPSGPKDKPLPTPTAEDIVVPSTEDNDIAKSTTTDFVEKAPPMQLKYHLSPYHVYEDYKPPTSPSPSAPTASRSSTSTVDGVSQITSGNNTPQPPPVDQPREEHHHVEAKPRPLSPYTMYEDMKPPTSPIPSPRKS